MFEKKFSFILVIKTWIRIRIDLKCWIRIRIEINTDPNTGLLANSMWFVVSVPNEDTDGMKDLVSKEEKKSIRKL